MTTSTIRRPVRVLAAVLLAGALAVAVSADGSGAAPHGCRGLSPASAIDCPASVFTP